MKVYVYPADTAGCGYYRLIWPAMALKQQGFDVKVVHPENRNRMFGEIDQQTQKLKSISAPKDADVMVFQRVSSKVILQAIPVWQQHGIAVVLDIDDDMSAIHPSNPAWSFLHPQSGGKVAEYDWNTAHKCYDIATYVTTSTDALLIKYARHGRGRVIHNRVPDVVLDIEHNEIPDSIGWGGTVRTHPDDPLVTGRAMGQLQAEGYQFGVVGPLQRVQESFKLPNPPAFSGAAPLDRWFHELSKLAVGIAPLTDSKFNHAKSWLKMLEYAAVGVPCVGSALTEYKLLNSYGIGFLASKPKEWYRLCKRLLDDDALRFEKSLEGREIVREHFTLNPHVWRLWEAWEDALKIQRG